MTRVWSRMAPGGPLGCLDRSLRVHSLLEKLADKMKIPHAKMPNNVVEHFGNNSGATIPTAITFNLRERLLREKLRVCLAGFGAGLTWSAMLISLGNVNFNTIIEYK